MQKKMSGFLVFLFVVLSLLVIYSINVKAVPQGPTVTSNVTASGPTKSPHSRADEGGTITTIVYDLQQQDYAWKAYIGNVTGKLTLDDADNYTIYDWTLATITGEVYATRASSTPNWTAIICANITHVGTEQNYLSMSSSDVDKINSTFNMTTHKSFEVAGTNFTANECGYVTATYINDTAQSEAASMDFQEIILYDGSDTIYTTILEQDAIGYESGSEVNNTYDFQMIVPENESTSQTNPLTYYFFVELG